MSPHFNDRDLPEPLNNPELHPQERSDKVFYSLSLAIALYAFLHKVLLPSALFFTSLKGTPWAQLDVWSFFIALWLLRFRYRRWPEDLTLIMTGLFTCYAVLEGYRVFYLGEISGWVAFSHLLASWPLGLNTLLVTLKSERPLRVPFFTMGALASVALFLSPAEAPDAPFIIPGNRVSVLVKPHAALSLPAPRCGSQNYTVISSKIREQNVAQYAPCGFDPPALKLKSQQKIKLHNLTSLAVTIHFYVSTDGGLGKGWNIWLAPRTQILSPPVSLGKSEIGLLFSDARPEAGVTVVLGADGDPHQRWQVSRQPLRAEKVTHEL